MIDVTSYGAVPNGTTDSTTAIQNAINAAKSLSAGGGGTYRATVYFPPGFYYITSPINITNANGIWLKGDGGPYINTGIIGNTSGIMFDFTGSTGSGCEGFSFVSTTGYGATRSTIGVQFALGTSSGGLNCGIEKCFFLLDDNATANNGLGSIGVVNIRSEEFYIKDCLIRANTPVILSNKASLADTGYGFTATSPYTTIASGQGSMGVTDILATSLQGAERRTPALILNGTNSVNFEGYIGRTSASSGSYDTAVLLTQPNYNISLFGTIESYSHVARIAGDVSVANWELVVANSVDTTGHLINISSPASPRFIRDFNVSIQLPNANERNRTVLYHDPVNGGDDPITTVLVNGVIACPDLPDNINAATGNILRACSNVIFKTGQPFEITGGVTRQLALYKVQSGSLGSVTPATVIRFTKCDRTTTATNNGGYFNVRLKGVVRGGNYGSGGSVSANFVSEIIVNRNQNGNYSVASVNTTLIGKSLTLASYIDISAINVAIDLSGTYGVVSVTPVASGSGTGEPFFVQATAEVQADFYVNGPAIFL